MKEKGITLIALIITIIILLILAGVTINVLIGERGLFSTAQKAGEDYKQAGAREKLEAVLVELQGDKITKQEYNEHSYIDNKLKQNNMEVEGNIVTVEGWQFEIDRSIPEIAQSLGKETEFKKDTRGKAKFVYDTETKNVKKVDVTIEIHASISEYIVQYNIVENSDASTNWVDYTDGSIIEVTKNITIYGRIIDKTTNEIGYKFSGKITTIDETAPQEATITFDKTETDVNQIIQATVTQSDLESGIDITNCKYIVNQSGDKLGEEHTSWNTATAFTQATQTLDITQANNGRYYLHVLSVDKAGNKMEIVSDVIRFKGAVTLWSRSKECFRPDIDQYWNYVNYGDCLRLQIDEYKKWRRVVSKVKIDVTDIDSLTLKGGNFSIDNFSGNSILDFILTDSTSGDTVVRSSNVINRSDGNYAVNLVIDTHDLTGEHFMAVRMYAASGANIYLSYLTGSFSIIGK